MPPSGRRRKGPLTWCYEDCVWFLEQLTLPEGGPVRAEGYARLILRALFDDEKLRSRLKELLGIDGDLELLVELLSLLPKGNGKTTIFGGVAVFHLLTVQNAQCFIAASDKEQADEMFRFAEHFVESEPEIQRLLIVRPSTRTIRARRGGGRLRVLASDKTQAGGKRHSYSPTLALIDELHAHENTNIYTALRSAIWKRAGKMATITTAGHDEEGVLGKLRKGMLEFPQAATLTVDDDGLPVAGQDGRLRIAMDSRGRNVMLEWACHPDDDTSDPVVVKKANPASFVTPASIEDSRDAPGITPWAFLRYRCNVWTLGFESWLPDGSFAALADSSLELEDGWDLFVAIDMARYRDCAAVVVNQPRADGPDVVRAKIWKSGGHDHPVDYGAVKDYLRDLNGRYRLRSVAYDPKYFDQSAQELADEGLPMEQFPQSNERMCPAWADLRTEIIEGEAFRHDGDEQFVAHLMAGQAKDVGDNQFRVVKSSANGPPIDAGAALAMVRVLARSPAPEIGLEFW